MCHMRVLSPRCAVNVIGNKRLFLGQPPRCHSLAIDLRFLQRTLLSGLVVIEVHDAVLVNIVCHVELPFLRNARFIVIDSHTNYL